jgi:hypothetical protein
MCWFSFWWKVPKGYMALELFFVSARTIKRHHHLMRLNVTLQRLNRPVTPHWGGGLERVNDSRSCGPLTGVYVSFLFLKEQIKGIIIIDCLQM